MSEIVPWNAPGGAPCCCEENCYTDFANQPKPVFAENSFLFLSSVDYTALYAGGTYTANVDIDITAERDSVGGSTSPIFRNKEQHLCSVSNVLLSKVTTGDEPCYERHVFSNLTVTRDIVTPDFTGTSDYTTSLAFVRSLGTEAGQRRLSLASLYNPSSTTVGPFSSSPIVDLVDLIGLFSTFPRRVRLRSGNMTNTVPYSFCAGSATFTPNLASVTALMSLSVNGGGTYSASEVVAHPCFNTSGHFDQVINGTPLVSFGQLLYATMFGSAEIQMFFSPSAP